MLLKEKGIEHKKIEETLVAVIQANIKNRQELAAILDTVRRNIPVEAITGPAFCIFQFVTSVTEGFEVEAGFPVRQAVQTGEITTRVLPGLEVLSLIHPGSADTIRESYRKLYGAASEYGLISDEFLREVYPESSTPEGPNIEVQFVLHNWDRLLRQNVDRVLGADARQAIMPDGATLTLETRLDERFRWVKGAMERLEQLANEDQRYDIVSSCAHVFPKSQIAKLKAVYEQTKAQTNDPLKAIDAVLDFMETDPGWGERPVREGKIIYSSKNPRDPQGYANAKDAMEKRKAYCFCPLVREHLDQDMPLTFCYCGAGWYRQQWEGTLGRPVRINIVQSILKGDDVCQFAIYLPDDLNDS